MIQIYLSLMVSKEMVLVCFQLEQIQLSVFLWVMSWWQWSFSCLPDSDGTVDGGSDHAVVLGVVTNARYH